MERERKRGGGLNLMRGNDTTLGDVMIEYDTGCVCLYIQNINK